MKSGRSLWWIFAVPLLLAGMPVAISQAGAPGFHVVELGAGSPIDVNSTGTVIGIDGTSAGPRPWIIEGGSRTYLPLPTGQTYAMVTRISDGGVVVGHVSAKPVIWTRDTGGYTAKWIPLPPGATGGLPTAVVGTHSEFQVLLNFGTPTFLTSPTAVYFSSSAPYLFDSRTDDLIDLVREYGLKNAVYVVDMTENGRILASNGMILGPAWAPVTPAPPPRTASWTGFAATRLNEKGEFVVTASLATSDGHGEIARYSPDKGWFVIETFIGRMYPFSADGISEEGDALSSQYAGHMFTTTGGERLSLNGLLLDPGYALTSAPGGAISNNGKIVSVARNPAGVWTAVRLDPDGAYPPPEPVVLSATAHPATPTAPWDAISLAWTASPTATAYAVERKGPTDASFVALTPASGTIQLKYDDTAIAPSTIYTYRVIAIGLGGAGDPSNEVTVQSPAAGDSVPPSARITSPANGAVVSGPVTVSAEASDNVGLRGFEIRYAPNQGSEVLCGKTYATVQPSDTLSCSWDPRYLPSGTTAQLIAYAYDALGNYVMNPISVTYQPSAVEPPPVVVDTTAPKVSILEPANNATVSGNVAVRASAQDDVGVARMEIRDSDGMLLDDADGGAISYVWNTSGLSKRQTLTVRAYDKAGNIGAAKVTVRIRR